MKYGLAAFFAALGLSAWCNAASAQSTDDIMQRLNAVERSSAEIVELKRENAALRERVQRLERGKLGAVAPATQSVSKDVNVKSTTGHAAYGATASVYKAALPVEDPIARSWTGFYAGGHGGGGWAREAFDHPYDPTPNGALTRLGGDPFLNIRARGGVFGGQFGFNWQFTPNWVVGIEADMSATTMKKTEMRSANLTALNAAETTTGNIESKVRDLGTLRGKIGFISRGFIPRNDILIYGTGGLAWAQLEHASSGVSNGTCIPPGGLCLPPISIRLGQYSQSFSETTTQFGWGSGRWRRLENLGQFNFGSSLSAL